MQRPLSAMVSPLLLSAATAVAPICPFWLHADVAFSFDEVVGFVPGNISFDACCSRCGSTAGCQYFSTEPGSGCTLATHTTASLKRQGTMSGSVVGPALPQGWHVGDCGQHPIYDCPSSLGCFLRPLPGRGKRCGAVDPKDYTVGAANISCAPVKVTSDALVVDPYQYATVDVVPDCPESQCVPKNWIAGTPGCNCSTQKNGHCCALGVEYCTSKGCANAYDGLPDYSHDQVQHPRCWAVDETTGDLFCAGFDREEYRNQNGVLVKTKINASCELIAGVRFKDAYQTPPPHPASMPPRHGECGADFCACCDSGEVYGGFNSTGADDCTWKCSNVQKKVSIATCSKPSTLLSKCGERTFLVPFNPCKSLCSSPTPSVV